jgi:uncharacterized protein YkwD
MPLLVKAGVFMLLPLLAIAGLVMAITDGAPTVTARAEGGSRLPAFETPGTSSTSDPGGAPSGTPTDDGGSPSPTDSATPSPEETGEEESSSGGGSGDGSGSGSGEAGEDEDLVATTPPREPGERPTSPDDPTDDPSTPQDPEPSPDPSEPSEPDPTEDPTDEPTDEPDAGLPDLPILDLSQAELQMVDAVDDARAEAGCPALRVDPRLTLASREHSEDMRERSYYSHVNPDGKGPEERAADEGYTAPVGENLSQGVRSAQQVVRSWEDGGDERDRLLDCSYTSVGVGTERGGLLGLSSWWTLMLGTD